MRMNEKVASNVKFPALPPPSLHELRSEKETVGPDMARSADIKQEIEEMEKEGWWGALEHYALGCQ